MNDKEKINEIQISSEEKSRNITKYDGRYAAAAKFP